MRFYVIRAREALCWVIGGLVVLFALGVGTGRLTERGGQAKAVSIDLSQSSSPAEGFTLEVLSVAPAAQKARRVFLYHTHTYEAYEMEGKNVYTPTETWRTKDSQYNMVRVGEELAQRLREAGIFVTHDTTAYEPPRLSTAYSRSLEGLETAVAEGYDLYIDLHRDSYSKNNGPNTVTKGQTELARFLFLIGQGTGTGFDERPDWESNQKVAKAISDSLNRQAEGISRGVSLKSGRYNQQAATPVLLIEAGNNKNTLPQVLEAMPYLAHAICEYFDSLE